MQSNRSYKYTNIFLYINIFSYKIFMAIFHWPFPATRGPYLFCLSEVAEKQSFAVLCLLGGAE